MHFFHPHKLTCNLIKANVSNFVLKSFFSFFYDDKFFFYVFSKFI